MNPLLAFGGPYDWLIIAGIMFLLFGSRLPTAMRSLGQGVTEFKKGLNDPTETGDTKIAE